MTPALNQLVARLAGADALAAFALETAAGITRDLVARAANELRRIENVANEVDELRDALGLSAEVVTGVYLRPSGRRILGMLLRRPSVPTDSLVAALYAHVPEADRPNDPRATVKVLVHYLRRDLRPYGIEIETLWRDVAATYRLNDAMKAKARALFAPARSGAAA